MFVTSESTAAPMTAQTFTPLIAGVTAAVVVIAMGVIIIVVVLLVIRFVLKYQQLPIFKT